MDFLPGPKVGDATHAAATATRKAAFALPAVGGAFGKRGGGATVGGGGGGLGASLGLPAGPYTRCSLSSSTSTVLTVKPLAVYPRRCVSLDQQGTAVGPWSHATTNPRAGRLTAFSSTG